MFSVNALPPPTQCMNQFSCYAAFGSVFLASCVSISHTGERVQLADAIII